MTEPPKRTHVRTWQTRCPKVCQGRTRAHPRPPRAPLYCAGKRGCDVCARTLLSACVCRLAQ
eukprot:1459902-Lingulodinium_polyedra.AAC.1